MGLPPSEWNYPPEPWWRTVLIGIGWIALIILALIGLDVALGWVAEQVYGVIS